MARLDETLVRVSATVYACLIVATSAPTDTRVIDVLRSLSKKAVPDSSHSLFTEPCSASSGSFNIPEGIKMSEDDPDFQTVLKFIAMFQEVINKDYREMYKNRMNHSEENCKLNPFNGFPGYMDPMEQISTCPFYWVEDYMPNRIPQLLMKAKCVCKEPRLKSKLPYGVESTCEEVSYKFLNLWRVKCHNSEVHQYIPVWVSIPVACVQTLYYEPDSVPAHTLPTMTRTP